jgi:galactoside O-acetyltransferase
LGFLTENEISGMGFKAIGKNVKLSNKASFYNCSKITIGDESRIDDFSVISAGDGELIIGRHVHIAVFVSIIGSGKITLSDFCGVSSRSAIYSSNDDYSGNFLTNPTVPKEYTNVSHEEVYIGRHVIIGSGSIILPGVRLEDGVAIGALSLVSKSCESFGIYIGVPAKKIKNRSRKLIDLEFEYASTRNI